MTERIWWRMVAEARQDASANVHSASARLTPHTLLMSANISEHILLKQSPPFCTLCTRRLALLISIPSSGISSLPTWVVFVVLAHITPKETYTEQRGQGYAHFKTCTTLPLMRERCIGPDARFGPDTVDRSRPQGVPNPRVPACAVPHVFQNRAALEAQPLDYEKPGLAQHYCVECAK